MYVNLFCDLKLEIALAIPASNEWKKKKLLTQQTILILILVHLNQYVHVVN